MTRVPDGNFTRHETELQKSSPKTSPFSPPGNPRQSAVTLTLSPLLNMR